MQPKVKKRNFKALEERRLRAVYLFKKGAKQAEIAHRLGVTRQAVHIWYKKYQKGGKRVLLATKATGRPPKLPFPVIKQKLPKILTRGAIAYGFFINIWTTATIAAVIKKEFGVNYHRDHVRKLLHALGFSWQKPRRQALERDETGIKKWVKNEWPVIKKKPVETRPY